MIDGDKLIDRMVGTKLRDDEWPIVRDIIRELVAENDRLQSAVEEQGAEIERLSAEVQTWINHTKTAVWSDSEECKFLTAEVERLRAGGCARDQGTTQFCAEAAALAAENERLRAALRHYVGECLNCNGEGVKPQYDLITGKSLWRDCVVCVEARAALETPTASAVEDTP